MTVIAGIVFALLAAIAAMHVAWAFGICWPAKNERDLVALVVGYGQTTTMPGTAATLAAAAAIFAAGLVALGIAGVGGPPAPGWSVTAAGAGAALTFAGRGLAAYLPFWRLRFRQEPFATMDRHYYGPLCLALALAFAALVNGRSWS